MAAATEQVAGEEVLARVALEPGHLHVAAGVQVQRLLRDPRASHRASDGSRDISSSSDWQRNRTGIVTGGGLRAHDSSPGRRALRPNTAAAMRSSCGGERQAVGRAHRDAPPAEGPGRPPLVGLEVVEQRPPLARRGPGARSAIAARAPAPSAPRRLADRRWWRGERRARRRGRWSRSPCSGASRATTPMPRLVTSWRASASTLSMRLCWKPPWPMHTVGCGPVGAGGQPVDAGDGRRLVPGHQVEPALDDRARRPPRRRSRSWPPGPAVARSAPAGPG